MSDPHGDPYDGLYGDSADAVFRAPDTGYFEVPPPQPPPPGWPDGPSAPTAVQSSVRPTPWPGRILAAATAAVATAAILAPFLTFFRLQVPIVGETATEDVSGWGGLSFHGRQFASGGHEIRYGVPLLVGAILLVGAALGLLGPRGLRAGLVALIAGGATVAATAGIALLEANANASYDATPAHYSVGPGFWLLLVTGIVAAVLVLLAIAPLAQATPQPTGPA